MDLIETPAVLQQLNRLLDECLDLGATAVEPWLAALPAPLLHLAPTLRCLVAQQSAGALDSFLMDGPTLPDAPVPCAGRAGMTWGLWVLQRELGRGGMGTVWLARHQDDGRQVAVKLPHLQHLQQTKGTACRLADEAAITGLMHHPRVTRLVEFGTDPQHGPYLALPWVEGTKLDLSACSTRLQLSARLRLFLQMVQAVAHVHAQGVVHRDLKPSNFIVDTAGRVHLIDFGIAVRVCAATGQAPADAQRGYTPAYAAPEQLRGEAVARATDVYALGLMLRELVNGLGLQPAGRLPGVNSVIARALSPRSDGRYSNAQALAAAVQGLLHRRLGSGSKRADMCLRPHRRRCAGHPSDHQSQRLHSRPQCRVSNFGLSSCPRSL